ncbi:MAG: sigma-70 family RNA polymerase sigma factor [bacterium]
MNDPGYHDMADEELMALVQENDEVAFELLVERYQHVLASFVSRYLGHGDQVQDILQETFIRVWRHRKHYRTVAKFSTWIYTIAGNLAKTELRRWKVRRSVPIRTGGESPEDEAVDLVDEDADPTDNTRREEIRETITREIQLLPEVYRQAVILRDLEDKSYEEISELLDVPVGTVKSRVNRGRERLQVRLRGLL